MDADDRRRKLSYRIRFRWEKLKLSVSEWLLESLGRERW